MQSAVPTFRASEEFKPRGKWISLPQSGLRVHLTCPGCNHRYPVVHKQCRMHVEISDVLRPNAKCTACQENGHEASLPADIADCPNCGLQCRSVEQVVGSDSVRRTGQRSPKDASTHRRAPRIKAPCFMCGSPYGINTHHIDWNHDNNAPANLATLCHHCHEQNHKLGKPLFDELRQRITNNPAEKEQLKSSSLKRHRELYCPVSYAHQPTLFDIVGGA